MEVVECSNNAPILNFTFSLQKSSELTNVHMMTSDEMQCMILKVEVKRRMYKKEPLELEFWLRSYAHLKFHVHLAKF